MLGLANLSSELNTFISLFKANFIPALLIVASLWLIQIINMSTNYRLNYLGIYPRHIVGLRGIIFSPFLHGSVNHLFLNSIPLLILTDLILSTGTKSFIIISFIIIGLSGFAVWLLGRKALHVGASGVIMGYFGYLFANAYWHPSLFAYLLALLCLLYFSGLFLNLFHTGKSISWEGHVLGFIAGLLAAYWV